MYTVIKISWQYGTRLKSLALLFAHLFAFIFCIPVRLYLSLRQRQKPFLLEWWCKKIVAT